MKVAKQIKSTSPAGAKVKKAEDLAPRTAAASAYLARTQKQFLANALKAQSKLMKPEAGVLVGPAARLR